MTLCIALKINRSEILPIVKAFTDYAKGIEEFKPYTSSYDFHVSIGYVSNDDPTTLQRLNEFADQMKKDYTLPHFKATGISVFNGKDGKNYIVLNLSEELPYIQLGKELSKQFNCTVPHPHVSLGYTEKDVDTNIIDGFIVPNHTFKTTKIQVWDKNYKVVKEARMQKKASLVKTGNMTTAEILDYEHQTFHDTTPVYSIPVDDVDLDLSSLSSIKKIANLISTLTEQVKYNRPDTLSKIASIVTQLEKYLK